MTFFNISAGRTIAVHAVVLENSDVFVDTILYKSLEKHFSQWLKNGTRLKLFRTK